VRRRVEQYGGTGRRPERRERRQPFAEPGFAGRERKAAREVRRELEQLEISGEHEARERSLAVVRAAFAEREPQPHRRSWKPLTAVAIALVVVAGLLSPPGRAVLDEIREAVGVEKAQPALFSLPTHGRLLVTADSGAWVVEEDGSKRLLGSYGEASWSPFGRFVVASRANELVALTPAGDVRWSLARPNVRFPRWGGTRADTRIAYLSGGELRVVGGDGKGDRVLDARAAASAPSWRPGPRHVLAYMRRDGTVRVVDTDTDQVLAREEPHDPSEADDQAAVRRLLGDGDFAQPVRSPDGRWLAVGWPSADQLVFLRVVGRQQIRAVSNVSGQFRSQSFPTISGWCCAP
jgi:hypothetical protein